MRAVSRRLWVWGAVVVVALMLGTPARADAQGQAATSLSAAPSPFVSDATITINASVAGQWQGEPPPECEPPYCEVGEVLTVDAFIVVQGSTGFYASHEAWGTPTASTAVQWFDPIPGQTMTATTYTLTAQVVWTVCVYYHYNPTECVQGQYTEDGGESTVVQPAVLPVADEVTPSSGAGPSETFTLQVSSPAGASDIAQAFVWFDATGASDVNSCVIAYGTAGHELYLLNDQATNWSVGAVGVGPTLQNSQCTVSPQTAGASPNGNAWTITVPVTFAAGEPNRRSSRPSTCRACRAGGTPGGTGRPGRAWTWSPRPRPPSASR